MKKQIFILITSFTFILQAVAQQARNSNADTTIYYNIKPVPLADRTNLEISVHYKTKSDTAIIVNLPQDCYGTPDYYKYIISFEGQNGCIVKPANKQDERLVLPNIKKEIILKYIISVDPKVMDDISFAPNVSSTHFHLGGCQWLLPIGNTELIHRYIIKIVDAPKGWHLYSSIGPDPKKIIVSDSYDNLLSTAIGGGAQAYRKIIVHGKPVFIFIAGHYNIPNDSIFNAVSKIVTLQREWFSDFDSPFYTVTINPRTGIIAGTCIPNLFVCFMKQEIKPAELNVIISHEMFHTWLPNKIYVKPTKGESDLTYEWFAEGFTDYFGRKILSDAGLLSLENFVALINRDIINIADNPNHSATYADLIAASRSGKYGTAYKKLSYYRGALIALNWETQLSNSGTGKHLKDFIQELYSISSKNNFEITKGEFFNTGTKYGIDIKNEVEKYIIRGLPIITLPDALGNSFQLSEAAVPSFDPSFSLQETFKTRKIKGVVQNGNAYNAGLRNEMDFVDIHNSNRFGNGWSPDKPMTVTVRIDGLAKVIEFFPRGNEMTLMLYYPVK